ncbi:MAG: site-2 protease family protein [Nitrososphaerales archaeon]
MAEDSSSTFYIEQRMVAEKVKTLFHIRNQYFREQGAVEFEVEEDGGNKLAFLKLIKEIKPLGYLAVLRRGEGYLTLIAFRKPEVKKRGLRLNLILLLATLGTVAADGFFKSSNYPGNLPLMIGLYAVGIMGIIGVHEMGHKIASALHGVKSSPPYFIPGIPGALPTLGAVITSSEPPTNRDSLFDLGISGPLAGLAVTLLVAVGGALTSAAVPIEELSRQAAAGKLLMVSNLDIFTAYLLSIFAPQRVGTGIILSPLIFASSLGFLITFLNLMPAWQLDGGHVARAVLSPKLHKILTYASIAVLFITGFQLMAILILILSMRSPEMKPLDDVSPLSKSRKIMFILVWVIAALIYIFAIRSNPFFFR